MNKYHLILGDSSEYIKNIPDQSIDLILTDPPYNLGRYSTGNIKMSWRKDFNNDVAEWDTTIFNPAEWLDEFIRILKPTGTIFAFTSYNLLGQWHQVFDPVFDTFQFIVWHKTNPPPKLRRAGFLNSCELIVCVWNKGHTWNFTKQKDMHNFIESPICKRMETVTPELFTSGSEDHEDIAGEDIADEDGSLEEPWLFASNQNLTRTSQKAGQYQELKRSKQAYSVRALAPDIEMLREVPVTAEKQTRPRVA